MYDSNVACICDAVSRFIGMLPMRGVMWFP